MLEFRSCEGEVDTQWSLRWNETTPRKYVEQKCPGEFAFGWLMCYKICLNNHELFYVGMSNRLCDYGGIWLQPNVSTCGTRKFIDIKNKVMTIP